MEQQKKKKYPTWVIILIIVVVLPFWLIIEFSNYEDNGSVQRQVTPAPRPSKSDLEIVCFEWIEEEGDYNCLRDSVKNTSNATITYFEVVADYLNGTGNIVDSEYTIDG